MPNSSPPLSSLQLKEIFEAKIDKLKNKPKLYRTNPGVFVSGAFLEACSLSNFYLFIIFRINATNILVMYIDITLKISLNNKNS